MSAEFGATLAAETLLSALGTKLRQLPAEKFVAAIELLNPIAERRTVIELFDEARPRLRELRPVRPITVKRILCQPFEDLLCSNDRAAARDGAVPRRAIEPLWQLLAERDPPGLDRLSRCLKAAGGDAKAVRELGPAIWRWGSGALAHRLPSAPGLDGAFAVMRDALASAPTIEDFKCAAPAKPLAGIDEALGKQIIQGLERLRNEGKPTEAFLLVIAARLASPADLFMLLDKRGGRSSALARRLDTMAAQVVTDRARSFGRMAAALEPDALATHAEGLLRTLLETSKALGPAARGALEQETMGLAESVGGMLNDRVVVPAPEAVERALAERPDRATVAAAESYARALGRSRKIATTLGLAGSMEGAITRIRGRCDAQIARCLDELERPAWDGETPERRALEGALYRAIRLIELAEGSHIAQAVLAEVRGRLRQASELG